MRGKKFTEKRIIGILKEAELGLNVQGICRKYGMSDCAF